MLVSGFVASPSSTKLNRSGSFLWFGTFSRLRKLADHLSTFSRMPSAQDPFYVVKEEIQESIDKLQSSFHHWERIPANTGEQIHLSKELLASCGSIDWQVDELDKTIAVAARDPALYGIDEAELEKRRRWTSNARTQVSTVKKVLTRGKEQQDEELDELSASVQRIGGVGLTIHEELLQQEKIIDELGMEMDSTSNRLDFVQCNV
ncbi:hypothetical protein G4B88_003624 [Cannabis sativa]|uniref:t-SNARE coiled-coil homology domain-containing protein n=1 Tax=Cannabis sativa TaxID=3483 RepID=A0A7J6DK17_CANSA|nr:hypothetical protein G4B88_011458 [Cannabis sativa]KAF4346471.1 hypothetical protein G4B88_003624 [Cannabis sativa]